MGMAKRMMMEHDANIQWATGLLIKSGAASECESHGYLTDNLAGEEAVEEAAAEAAANPRAGLSPQEAADLVREAINDIGMECPGCERNAADD
jgi:hypothetical protein